MKPSPSDRLSHDLPLGIAEYAMQGLFFLFLPLVLLVLLPLAALGWFCGRVCVGLWSRERGEGDG